MPVYINDIKYGGIQVSLSTDVEEVEQATPVVYIDSNGLITASANQQRGLVESGTKTATLQLNTQDGFTVTPTEQPQVAVASETYTTGQIKVDAISPFYVGSNVSRTSGKTVNPTTSQQTVVNANTYVTGDIVVNGMPQTQIATPTISVSSGGLITASNIQSAGYVNAGSTSAEKQLTTKGAATIIPNDSEQTAVATNVYTTGNIKVAPVPSETYIKRSEIVTFRTGTSAPSPSLGNNGDLYLLIG